MLLRDGDKLSNALENQVQIVAAVRREREAVRRQLKERQEAWEKENAPLIEESLKLAGIVATAEDDLRVLALEIFQEHPEQKTICEGVKIRMETEIQYSVPEALGWAVEHKTCLQLDAKAFDAMMKKASSVPDFVTIQKVLKVTLAKELGI